MGAVLKRRLGSLLAGRGKGGILGHHGRGTLGAGSVGMAGSAIVVATPSTTVAVVFSLPWPAYVALG